MAERREITEARAAPKGHVWGGDSASPSGCTEVLGFSTNNKKDKLALQHLKSAIGEKPRLSICNITKKVYPELSLKKQDEN